MKRLLLILFPLLLAFGAFGANPPYTAFIGTNGIFVYSNPPQGRIIFDGKFLTNGMTGGLTTNANQFAGAPLSIRDGAIMSNTVFYGTQINNGTFSSRVLVLPTTAGLGWFNGSNQWYITNLTADTTILLTNLLEGADYFLQVSNPASFNVTFTSLGNDNWVEHPYAPGTATTNGITLFKFQRWINRTNAFEQGRNLTLTNDDGTITFATNRDSLIIRSVANGIGFGDLIWTNVFGDIQVIPAISTNIHFFGDGSLRLGPEATNGLFIDLSDPSIKSITVRRPNALATMQSDNNGFAIEGEVDAAEFGQTRFDVSGFGDTGGGNSSIDLGLQVGSRYVVHFDPLFAVGPTSYTFSSAYRVTNSDTLLSLQNSNAPVFGIGGAGQIMIGRGNQTPFPGVVLYGIYDTALGETNQQEIFTESKNSAVGYSGAADMIVDTNYGALILFANKEGGVKFTRFSIQAGQGVNPQNFNSFTMQGLVDGATYFQIDPNFSLLTPTNYLFSSSVRITNTDTLMSLQNSNTPVLEVDGVGDLRMIKRIAYLWPSAQGAAGTVLTNNGSGALGWGSGPTAAAILTGTTNFFNLSVQAAKLPATNYATIDAGWQAWETVYPKTNEVGSQVNLSATWQFMVPTDYATNSLKLLIDYSLLGTNGPNTSNVVFAASVLAIRNGTTDNIHTKAFGSVVRGSNNWIASFNGTNIVTNLVVDLGTSSLLMARDLCEIKLERRPTEDTYGGAVSVHGLQVEYTRP